MKNIVLLISACFCLSLTGCSQDGNPVAQNRPSGTDKKVGGSCEDCDAVYECPVSFSHLNERDTLPDFNEAGPKLQVSGVIFHRDGKTPAKDVVMYFYHTDQTGHYPTRGNETGHARRHGYLRGWIKTGPDGRYSFYTLRPASYPGGRNEAHIHATIKEPGKTAYWIDEFLFADDPLLPAAIKSKDHKARGGNGILTTQQQNGVAVAERNIILGLNIEGYGDN